MFSLPIPTDTAHFCA